MKCSQCKNKIEGKPIYMAPLPNEGDDTVEIGDNNAICTECMPDYIRFN